MLKKALQTLESVATRLEEKGLINQAKQIDAVLNTLEGAQPLMQRRDYGSQVSPELQFLKSKGALGLLRKASRTAASSMADYTRTKQIFVNGLKQLKNEYENPKKWTTENMGLSNKSTPLVDRLELENKSKNRYMDETPIPKEIEAEISQVQHEIDRLIADLSHGYEPAYKSDISKNEAHSGFMHRLNKVLRTSDTDNPTYKDYLSFLAAYIDVYVDMSATGAALSQSGISVL